MSVNTLGVSYADGKSRGGAWLLPLVPIAISIFAISALVSYHLRASTITPRTIPQSVVIGVYEFLGWVPACMFFGLVFAWSSIWFVAGSIDRPAHKLLRVFGLTVALAVFGNLDASAAHTGALGAWIGGGMSSVFGSFLSHLLMAPITFLALLFATDSFWMSYFERRVLERTRAELHAAAVGSASDHGVEPAVPEEFKQLARTLPPEAAGSAADDMEETDVDAYFERLDRGSPEAVASTDEVVDTTEDAQSDVGAEVEEEPAPVRLSYFERRRLREEQEAQRAAAAADPVAADEAASDADARIPSPLFEGLGELVEPSVVVDSAQEEPLHEATPAVSVVAEESSGPGSSDDELSRMPETAESCDKSDELVGESDASVETAVTCYEVRHEPLFASPSVHFVDEDDEVDADSCGEPSKSCEPIGGEIAAQAEVVAEGTAVTGDPIEQDEQAVSALVPEVVEGSVPAPATEPLGDVAVVGWIESEHGEALSTSSNAQPVPTEETLRLEASTDAASTVDASGAENESLVHGGDGFMTEPVGETLRDEAPQDVDDAADLSWQRVRGFLAPVVDDAVADEVPADGDAPQQHLHAVASASESDSASAEPVGSEGEEEPLVSIPRPADSRRQKSLFGGAVDEDLLRDAREICESARRASVVLLQRKLRIDYEQALVVLAQLAERGVLELQEDGTQGRVLN